MVLPTVEWPPHRVGSAPRRPLPRGLAAFMRPLLESLTADITEEVQRTITEYGPGPDGVDLTSTAVVIAHAVRHFVDQVAQPRAARAELDELLQRLGRSIAFEGRRLEWLTTAYAIGADMAWRQIVAMAQQHAVPPETLDDLGDELVDYMASLAVQSTAGFQQAQAQLSDAAHEWQAQLLELILAGPSAPREELASRAAAGGWTVPDSVALLAVRPGDGLDLPAARLLHTRALSALHGAEPVVLLPAPVRRDLRDEITALFAGHRVAIGCTVPLDRAADSLRWARRALDLVDTGVIPHAAVVDCDQHIGTLWIHAEPGLADIVVATTLAPLFAEPRNSRRILGQTLLHWITTGNPSAPSMAEALGVHPQTVRYRLKRLRDVFGDCIDDPQARLEMFFALRASAPLWNDGQPLPA